MQKTIFLSLISHFLFLISPAQSNYWQQRIKYAMDVTLDVNTNKLTGKQSISYTNNSPDTLRQIFIHLYWNAFKPGSMMDMSCKNAEKTVIGTGADGTVRTDYDRRFRIKISDMTPEEQGHCNITKFLFNGKPQQTKQFFRSKSPYN